ncbi:hypothetical protein VHA01S_074_00030 [Vibrio halioticoli NBRC 102217]|uniref:Initiator Rep protein WH1 domain-containing protein n=1 Tax=Vibrio halioticoli NBRC 102217 TaxID=1219072 RepID=V5FRC6_9VIBR|nr:replication initiation protein [Vibrio halioticoli]GAD91212.1 hypothetical protein VHA01S_074_00030 [Vibrio halioticoli NBRC 102217]
MNSKNAYPVVSDKLPLHIKKGHQLVFSRQDLSSREADLFALMIANMGAADWDGNQTPYYEFTSHNLTGWLNIESKHVGTLLSPVAERLSTRKIGIESKDHKGDLEFQYQPLFKRISYKNGVLTMVPNDLLRTEYIAYNQGFALINTKNFLELKREYSKRLYELLSRFKDQGTHIGKRSLVELKGLFGLLDEKGKLRSDKTSFANNGVFLQRCIRESIHELMANPSTNKELVFYEGPSGNLGYEPFKHGRSIAAIEFKVRWVKKGAVQELNDADAMATIKKLENKRLSQRQELETKELYLLKSAYEHFGRLERVASIEATLEKRNKETTEPQQVTQEVDDFFKKIEELESQFPDSDY